MDHVQLRRVLDFRRRKRYLVGICLVNSRRRFVLVCDPIHLTQ